MNQTKNDLPILLFVTPNEWREWLADNPEASGVWLRFYKKGKGESINYEQALQEALCYGWIDSQVAKYDDDSYLQKFTPRRSKSLWSKRNVERIEQLVGEGRMTARGLQEVEDAKADGRWAKAYEPSTTMEVPADFIKELEKHPGAKEFFETLNKANRYAIAWRLQTAKTDVTRAKRMDVLVTMMREGKRLH